MQTKKKTTIAKKPKAPVVAKMEEMPVAKQMNPQVSNYLKSRKVYIPIAIIVIILLAFIFKRQFVVALVNGQPITRYEYIQALEAKDGKTVIDSLIVNDLVYQEASKQGVTVTQSELDQDTKQIEDSLTKQGQNLDQLLAVRGMKRSDFETQLKTQKIIEKILGKSITVSDKEIQDYMDQNKGSLPTGLSDSDLRQQVKQQIMQQKLGDKAQAWIQDLQQKAKIIYF